MGFPDGRIAAAVAGRLAGRKGGAAVFTHQRPDPDALGSQAAMAILLRRMGVAKVCVVNYEEVPPLYGFLQERLEGAEVVRYSAEWGTRAAEFDTLVVVDTCAYGQLEPVAELLKREREKVVVLDHHLSRDDLSDFILTDTKAAAAVEIVWELAKDYWRAPRDAALAWPLMAGLVADTGWFRYDSVTARTHEMAADLTPHMDIARLYERLQQSETAPKLALMQRALASLSWSAGGKVAVMALGQRDFQETHATASQTEELVNLPLMVGTLETAALVTEMPDGRVRASLRGKHDVDVDKICRLFGGGGHAKAAGCRMDGPVEEAVGRLRVAMEAAVGSG